MSEAEDNVPIIIDFEQIEQVARVFFAESQVILEDLDELILSLEHDTHDGATLNNLFRRVHTLKGSVGAVPGGQLLGSLAHEFEALLSALKKEKHPVTNECIDLFLHSSKLLKLLAEGLREQNEIMPEVLSEVIELINRYGHFEWTESTEKAAPVKKLVSKVSFESEDGIWLTKDQLQEMMRISGEMLVLKNHFQMMMQSGDFKSRQMEFNQGLNKVSDLFQSQLGKALKVQAEDCFKGLSALVRQASTELNKEVLFTSTGLELWIDKNLGRDINEVLVHLIRNSIDHGVEDPFDRTVQGKGSVGQLKFAIAEKNGFVVIDFSDDGQGLNRERILGKAIENRLTTSAEAQKLSEQEIFQFIFHPGFSTKEKITTISGRGVGMDVVYAVVQKYQGKIHIESAAGQGAHFHMEFALPQHLMMESVLLCAWNGLQMAVPLQHVMQIQSVDVLQLTEMDGLRYCQWNGLTVPLLDYQEFIRREKQNPTIDNMSALFIRHDEHIVGFLVEEVLSQVDLMVRNFSSLIHEIPGFRGTCVLADDKVTYIVDPEKLVGSFHLEESVKEIKREAA